MPDIKWGIIFLFVTCYAFSANTSYMHFISVSQFNLQCQCDMLHAPIKCTCTQNVYVSFLTQKACYGIPNVYLGQMICFLLELNVSMPGIGRVLFIYHEPVLIPLKLSHNQHYISGKSILITLAKTFIVSTKHLLKFFGSIYGVCKADYRFKCPRWRA